jgi:hypothetical protein
MPPDTPGSGTIWTTLREATDTMRMSFGPRPADSVQ